MRDERASDGRRSRTGRLVGFRRALLAIVVLAVLSVGGWALGRSWLFALEGIDVVGNSALTRSQVLATSGLRPGMSVLSVDTEAVEAKLEALPLVREATVERLYPSKVRIRIRERTPVALVQTPAGVWLLDGDGTLISEAPIPAPKLPRVQINALVDSASMSEALRLWVALPAEEQRRVQRIDASQPDALVAFLGGVRVVFGTPDDLPAKVQAMSSLLSWAAANRRKVVSIDVRAPSRPAAVFS